MKTGRAKHLLFTWLALFVLFLPCLLNAQAIPNYELQLNLSSFSPEKAGEMYLRDQGFAFTDSTLTINQPVLEYLEPLEKIRPATNSTITINNSYQTTSINHRDIPDTTFAIKTDKGKWKIYGTFEQKYFVQVDPDKAPQDRQGAPAMMRGATRSASDGDTDELKTSISSTYYLEAVYSFKPTIKGKVALKHSLIDTFDTEKTIQIEGIVEPKPNMQIKAGFDNELGPENGVDNKPSKDTRVWTEFILKF